MKSKIITYQEAIDNYCQYVTEIINKIQSGKSKYKNEDPAGWLWRLDYSKEVDRNSSGSIHITLSGKIGRAIQRRLIS